MNLLQSIKQIKALKPYKVPGRTETYNKYNEGWADACDALRDALMRKVNTNYNQPLVEIRGTVQLMPRKKFQIFKKGWHKHTDIWGNPWWIRYNWINK